MDDASFCWDCQGTGREGTSYDGPNEVCHGTRCDWCKGKGRVDDETNDGEG